MSTSNKFTGRIQARGQYDYLDEGVAQESLLPGNVIAPSGGNVSKLGVVAAGVPFGIVTTDLYQGTYGNNPSATDQWNKPYAIGESAVPYQMPKPGSRYWVRTTGDEISSGDNVQLVASTGRIEPYGANSVDGNIVGVAITANFGNEQSDSAEADDLVLVQFS